MDASGTSTSATAPSTGIGVADTGSGKPGPARVTGGEVEALEGRTRTQGASERNAPAATPGERYEVRDAAAEVIYRVDTLDAAQRRAQGLGTTRILAIDGEGRRTPLQQVDGAWRRGEPLAPHPDRPAEAWAQERDDESAAKQADRGRTLSADQVPALGQGMAPATSSSMPRSEAAMERAVVAARLEAALAARYVVRRPVLSVGDVGLGKTEYRFRGDTARVAFTASTFKLATQSDNPSVARSMVDLAQARGWKGLRIFGSEDFRRLVWLEASVRGMRSQGYEPSLADQELVRREQESRQTNRIEPERTAQGPSAAPVDRTAGPARDQAKESPSSAKATPAGTGNTAPSSQKATGRGSGGRKAVLAAIEAVLVARGVTQARREAVLAAATEQLAARAQRGEAAPRIRVLDPSAPSQRPTPTRQVPDPQRQRDRAQPAMAPGR